MIGKIKIEGTEYPLLSNDFKKLLSLNFKVYCIKREIQFKSPRKGEILRIYEGIPFLLRFSIGTITYNGELLLLIRLQLPIIE
jgi:hypothetical protein